MFRKALFLLLLTLSLLSIANASIVELTDENFKPIALNKEKNVFVVFYAPWCGHCHNMMPTWLDFAKRYNVNGDTIIARLDASMYKALAKKYKIQGFPTIRLFSKKNKSGLLEYKGDREMTGFQNFLNANKDG